MDVIRQTNGLTPPPGGHVVTIGFFDGVHLGHQAVIRSAQAWGERIGLPVAVVTFEPHPAQVLRPDSAPKLLTDIDQKLGLLESLGVDATVVVPFDQTRANETADEFVDSVLVRALDAKVIVVGGDFHFGKNRGGSIELLEAVGADHGFEVEGINLFSQTGLSPVSSTLIRLAVSEGRVDDAAEMLGRTHTVKGLVVKGDQRGRTIGFPTANVAVPNQLIMPGDGVYAGWYLRPDRSRHPAAINIGKRPTFVQGAEHSVVEAHLIDFNDDLYGELAEVELVQRLRAEQRFDGIEALIAQLQRDVSQASALLLV